MHEFKVRNQENLALRKVDDEEFNRLKERYPQWNRDCPTCKGKGHFFYKTTWKCNCQIQKNLARHYLHANIGVTYHTLGFDDLFEEKDDLKNLIEAYLDNWEFNKQYGRGIIFYGQMGTGKTMAQVLILKELVKIGERCWFTSFSQAVADYMNTDTRKSLMREARSAACFSLDEVPKAVSEKQRDLYEEVFESIVRYRVENSMPLLIGTNLKAMGELFPRVDSLLQMSHLFYEMLGEDTRKGGTREMVDELINSKQVRPVK